MAQLPQISQNIKYPRTFEDIEQLKYEYKFWSTQNVVQLDQKVSSEGLIQDIDITNNDCSSLGYGKPNLVDKLEWKEFVSDQDLNQVKQFLEKYNYVSHKKFHQIYTIDNLRNYKTFGIITKSDKKIVGLIQGYSTLMQIKLKKVECAIVSTLCIHPTVTNKRLSTHLIKYITNHYVENGIKVGFFITNRYIPTPFTKCVTYNKPLNIQKLHALKYFELSPGIKMEDVERVHSLDSKLQTPNFVKLNKSDTEFIAQCFELFQEYMTKYNFHECLNLEEFTKRMFGSDVTCPQVTCPQVNVYIVLNESKDTVLDFISYTTSSLKSTQIITKGDLFYFTCLSNTLYRLLKDIMFQAKENGVDVFSINDSLENYNVYSQLEFAEYSTSYYNLYNWKLRPLTNIQIGYIKYPL